MSVTDVTAKIRNIIMRQAYLGVIAALDTFVCDTILTKITQDKDAFKQYFDKFYLKIITEEKDRQKKKDELYKMWDDNAFGNVEQDVICKVLDDSYCNVKCITSIYETIFGITISWNGGKIGQYFDYRHKIAHRNGRDKDSGELDVITKDVVEELISDINSFVEQIINKL